VSWSPVLDGAEREQAAAALTDIARGLRDRAADDGSLADGEAGVAIFFAYLARATGSEEHADAARERLGRAIEWAVDAPPHAYLFHGLTGVAWAVDHASAVLGDEPADDGDDPHVDIDEMVMEILARPPEALGFELLRGVAGLGVYALERLPRPTAARCATRAAEVIVAMADRTGGEATWLSTPARMPPADRRVHPDGYHSLGVPHGVPGAIAFLAAACAAGVAPAGARQVVAEGMAWMWRHRLDGAGADGPLFPAIAGEREAPQPAWCYGDAGAGAALLAAATDAAHPDWRDRALDVVRRAALRPAAGVAGALLCHGAAGVAHIAHRCHAVSGDPVFAAAARRWWARALEVGPGDAVGVLDGVAGVGLALIAATTTVAPRWDRMFLLSPR
jgi:hypothetical protein